MASVKRTRKLNNHYCKCRACDKMCMSIPGTQHRKCPNKVNNGGGAVRPIWDACLKPAAVAA